MKTHYKFRTNGAIGALLDEYERAIIDLQKTIQNVSETDLIQIIDPQTKDDDCRSIQTILTHVLRSGHVYVIYIRKHLNETIEFPERQLFSTSNSYNEQLEKLMTFTEQLFLDYPKIELESDVEHKIMTSWGPLYDVEQLMEHAIVHILRHRRQIEKFKIILADSQKK